MCQSSGAAGVSVPHHTGQTPVISHELQKAAPFEAWFKYSCFINVVVGFQLCVERCPDRHLTLVKAKVGNKDDHEYYRQYCKEGVDFAKLVSGQVVVAFMQA